jgi:hypothetical protein
VFERGKKRRLFRHWCSFDISAGNKAAIELYLLESGVNDCADEKDGGLECGHEARANPNAPKINSRASPHRWW